MDDGDGKKDTGSRTNRTHKVCNNRKKADAHASKGCCSWDVTVEYRNHGRIPVPTNCQSLITKLLCHIARRRARNVNPSAREDSTSGNDEGNVDNSMDRVGKDIREVGRGGDVVCESTHRFGLSWCPGDCFPFSQKTNKNVVVELLVKHLRDEVQVGNHGSLKNDRNVGSVEELDWVGCGVTTDPVTLERNFHLEPLKVDNNHKHQNGCQKIGDVWQVLTVKRFPKRLNLVWSSDQQMEEGNDCSLKFSSTSSVNSCRTECFPHDAFTDVCSDKERNTRSKAISLLK
mmetsp:Transcript_19908/g.32758  ORF Transcript_19908/g.32758 Transcript_19908/m.32758 type:complete len:287 (+) Transcript_19908:141-1001(+)